MSTDHMLLAIDDAALPLRKNLCLYLSTPRVRAEPVLTPSAWGSGAPDDLAAHFYGTVLHEGGRFRMWYYACHWGKNPDWPPRMMQQVAKSQRWFKGECPIFQGPLCYAESDDGIRWTKPALGQVLFKGSRANNALALPHTVVSGAIVIRDGEDPDPARRYKMTYQFFGDQSDPPIAEYGRAPSIALAVSPDGLRWTMTGVPFPDQFIEPSSFIRHAGQYIVHYQVAGFWAGYCAEGGTPCGRAGMARVTSDWNHWPDVIAEAFVLAEPEDRTHRGPNKAYDQVHLGVGAASFGNVCVGLYGLWHDAETAERFDRISCDFGLLVSNDGVRFREPVKGHRFLRRDDSLVTPVPGHAFNTILCQANGILNVGDETRIYHGRWRNVGAHQVDDALRHYSAEVALATLPRDRWGALGLIPKTSEAVAYTSPLTVPPRGSALTLNADGLRGIQVDVTDPQLRPIAGFSDASAGRAAESNGLDAAIHWPHRHLGELEGQSVRLRIRMTRADGVDPRLYAAYVNRVPDP